MSDDLQDLLNSKVNTKKPARIHDDSVGNSSTLNPAPLSSAERVEETEADQSPFMGSLVKNLNEGAKAEEACQSTKESVAVFSALSGDPNTLRSRLTFDEDTYKKAKPHFVAAWLDVKDVGYSVKELINHFYDLFGEKITPYLARFVKDVRDNNLEVADSLPNKDLTDAEQGATIEEQGGGKDANRQEQGDLPGGLREDGDTTETDSDRALGGLEADGSQAADSGATPAVGGTESGAESAQGDKGTDGGRVPKSRGGRGGAAKVHTSQAGGKGKGQEKAVPRVEDAPVNIPAANFVITDEVGLGQGGEPEENQSPFTVLVDDNYHYMDGDSRYTAGKFDTWEEALALAEKIVDETVIPAINDGLSPEDAISSYRHFGEDPWIIGNGAVPEGESFSAWSYAEKRAFQLYALKNRMYEESDNERVKK